MRIYITKQFIQFLIVNLLLIAQILVQNSKYKDFWVNLEVPFKQDIKTRFLESLKTQKAIVRSQITGILAAIACIEIPRNEWDELIPTLCTSANVSEANTDLRHASLQTLGYICEDMKPDHLRDEMKNQIIQVLVTNISEEAAAVEITKVAIKALESSMGYTTKCFSDETDRRFIMEKILQACLHPDEDIKEYALICLRDIAEKQYFCIEGYFQQICKVTGDAANSESSKVGASAFEFWTTLAEVETEMKSQNQPTKNLIDMCKGELLELIFAGILTINFEEDEDDDEWGHSVSALCCL